MAFTKLLLVSALLVVSCLSPLTPFSKKSKSSPSFPTKKKPQNRAVEDCKSFSTALITFMPKVRIIKGLSTIKKDLKEQGQHSRVLKELLAHLKAMKMACYVSNGNYMGRAKNGMDCTELIYKIENAISTFEHYQSQPIIEELGEGYGRSLYKAINDADLKSTALKIRVKCVP